MPAGGSRRAPPRAGEGPHGIVDLLGDRPLYRSACSSSSVRRSTLGLREAVAEGQQRMHGRLRAGWSTRGRRRGRCPRTRTPIRWRGRWLPYSGPRISRHCWRCPVSSWRAAQRRRYTWPCGVSPDVLGALSRPTALSDRVCSVPLALQSPERADEQLVGSVEGLGDHPHVGDHGHEIGVARPAGDDV